MPLYCSFDMQGAFILVSGDQAFAFNDYFFTNYYYRLAPKTSLQGPLWPSSKTFLAETLMVVLNCMLTVLAIQSVLQGVSITLVISSH